MSATLVRLAEFPLPNYLTPDSVAHKAHTQAQVSTVTFVLGAALLAGGVALFLTAPKDGAVSVQPSLGPSTAGIRLGGSWR